MERSIFNKEGRELVWDLALSTVWALYAAAFLSQLMRGGGFIRLGQMAALTIFAVLFLLRRPPLRRSGALWETLLALIGTLLPLTLRPAGGGLPGLGEIIQFTSLLGVVAAAVSLGRSFGVAPADRGLRTTGLYRWVRHPLYATEISFFIGYTVANLSSWNLLVSAVATAIQVARITREERILDGYANYSARVRWRLLPLVW